MEYPGEKEMFRVERHLLYASNAAAVTHWERQKADRAAKAKAKTKKKSNPKPDADPPAEPAPKPAKPEPRPEAKQAPQPEPKAAPQAAPLVVDAPAHPSAKPAVKPPGPGWSCNPVHGPPLGGPNRPEPRGVGRHERARTRKHKQVQERLKLERFLCACAAVHKCIHEMRS